RHLPRRDQQPRAALLFGALLAAWPVGRVAAQEAPAYDRYSVLWLAYFGDHQVAPRLALIPDVQMRTVDFGTEAQQLLLRAGMLYDLGPGVRAGGGYALITTFDYGEFTPEGTSLEHRAWQQLNMSLRPGTVAILNRVRLEQRWIGNEVPGTDDRDWTFQWRARYLLRAAVPLRGQGGGRGDLYAFGQDEVFVRWGTSQPTNLFDQNRLQLGLGVHLAGTLRLEASYFNLVLLRGDGSRREVGNGLVLALFSSAAFR
ncbi:MAG: DUF2490 domain-containing protein, partial [Gemmatimonadales bacterium]|nr:DUF2490 domain-containing protein [Gemmatimonadales bacterium]